VPDDDRGAGEAGIFCNGQNFRGPDLVVVANSASAVAMTGEIESDGVPLAREHRSEERPPSGVGRPTVNEDETGSTAFAPVEVVDVGAYDVDP
jgi:hypothetical protein